MKHTITDDVNVNVNVDVSVDDLTEVLHMIDKLTDSAVVIIAALTVSSIIKSAFKR